MDNICLFMNGDRGLAVLKSLLSSSHEVSWVILPSSKRNSQIFAEVNDLGVKQAFCESTKNEKFFSWFVTQQPNISIVAGYSDIFPSTIIDVPLLGTINLHAGKLPEYRGGSPLNWQLINGEPAAGISVIKMDEGIDSGPILARAEVVIDEDTTINDLHLEVNKVFPELVLTALSGIEDGNNGITQEEQCAAYWHQRNDADGEIFWRHMSSDEVYNLVRAVSKPYPGAFAFQGDDKVRIRAVRKLDTVVCGVPGRVLFLQGNGPLVVCRDKAILISEYEYERTPDKRLRHGNRFR